MKATKTFHASNYGRFGAMLPTDTHGYVHLTIAGWVRAGYSRDEARELARNAKAAVREADEALVQWRAN